MPSQPRQWFKWSKLLTVEFKTYCFVCQGVLLAGGQRGLGDLRTAMVKHLFRCFDELPPRDQTLSFLDFA